MRKFIIVGLMASTLVPVAAQAQRYDRDERIELRNDRRDIRDERRDLQDARREYRGDVRDARRDWSRDDWRRYRESNRDLYRGGNWRSGYTYRYFAPGVRLDRGYYAPRYTINDYGRYRLPHPGYNQRWIRNYRDVLLIDVRSGRVIDVIRNFYW